MSRRFRSISRLPTELTWEERNQPNYLFKPSKAFAQLEKMDMNWFYSYPTAKHTRARMASSHCGKNLKYKRK
jgi:hypothetical protein